MLINFINDGQKKGPTFSQFSPENGDLLFSHVQGIRCVRQILVSAIGCWLRFELEFQLV